jgi:predicted RNase H-like HicB family nuclease
MSEIIFEVREDEVDGGYTATALGYGIHTQGETLEELRKMVRDAVSCYFDTPATTAFSELPYPQTTALKWRFP